MVYIIGNNGGVVLGSAKVRDIKAVGLIKASQGFKAPQRPQHNIDIWRFLCLEHISFYPQD